MATTQAIRIHSVGGPEVMRLDEVPLADPGRGEARVRHRAIGVNYVDVYHRSGLYPLPLPTGLGVEAAGVVEAVGPGTAGVAPGDRVAYMAGPGCYAGARVVAADRLVPIPAAVDDVTAAAVLLKGLTAHMLVTRVHAARAGEVALVTAAAGGVGQLLVQWLGEIGVTVVAVVGSEEKAEIVLRLGAPHVLVTPRDDVPRRVKEITGGAGVPVAYDSVGRATFESSLACLAPFGLLVTFGNASGPLPPVDTGALSRLGSLAICRPTVFHHVASAADLGAAAAAVFTRVGAGTLRVAVGARWPLAGAADAHRALEARATTGSSILLP